MSWFDTSGLTSLAKSALKEAQKTIDKALDIQQDGIERQPTGAGKEKSLTDPTPTPVKEGDFFSTWGLTSSDSVHVNNTVSDHSVITQSPSKIVSQSLWGSFTGSFFETGGAPDRNEIDKDTKTQLEMIVDDSSEVGTEDEPFSKSKLVVHGMSEDSEGGSTYSRLNSDNDKESIPDNKSNYESGFPNFEGFQDILSSSKYEISTVKNYSVDNFPVTLRRSSDRQTTPYLNRLSIISSESGKNSSESIEVLGSQSLKTTPDSEIASLNRSTSVSSSNGVKLTSSSVEVLPESLMSPSSIEFLGFNSYSEDLSRASDEEFCSPVTSPIEDDNSSIHTKINSKASTDEDIKVIADVNVPGNDDEDVSAADDTISYNSISEFTTPTVFDSTNIIKSVDLFPTIKQYSNEMMDSFGSDQSGGHLRSSEDLPITRAPSRNTSQFTTPHPTSVSTFLSKDYAEKIPIQLCSSNIIHMDNANQPIGHGYQNPLINDSYASSNEGSWSDRTLNAESEGAGMESSTEDAVIKISDKPSTSFYVTGMLEDAIDDKSSDKASDSSSCCKLGESSDLIHPTWKDTNFSSSSHSYEEVDKASSIDQMENVSFSHLEFAPREQNSPGSSESRSGDMVKVGSEQTSGHTSGDDLETTTSSDIEIIPSPNGDYGNIYSISRESPAKLPMKFSRQSGNIVDLVLGKSLASKIRGHNRELSEASSQSNTSDDSHCSETERLMKRLAEMAEILESRESKLIEVSRKNVELLENNSELKICIENLEGKQEMGDVSLITEEYTLRMSALEKKFQQAIRDKDILRKQMETCKQEAATRMSSKELESVIGERDETVKELREEGEKLSKQQLHHSTIIKKLRTKEKENEQVIKTLRDKVAEQAQELDRLKRSLSSKEAVECSQIETVYKLTASNKKLDSELADTKGLLDDSNQKLDTMKTSLEAARKELIELQRNSTDLVRRQETLTSVEKEKASTELENEHLTYQLEELRLKMRQDEQRWMNRETSLRGEASRQMARAEEAESALQLATTSGIGHGECGMGAGSAEGTAILAQLTALQESALERDRRAQTREMRLQQSAADAQSKLSKISEKNQLLRDECQTLSAKLANVENNLSKSIQKLDACTSSCEEHMMQLNITLESNERLKHEYDGYKEESTQSLKDFKEKVFNMEQHLSMEKAACEAEKRRNVILQEQLRDIALSSENQTVPGSSLLLARLVGASSLNASNAFSTAAQPGINNVVVGVSGRSDAERTEAPSPPGSTGRDSLASESLCSGIWPLDDGDSCAMGSTSGVPIGDGIGGMCALERLQASLQRREGELRAARKAGKRSHAQRTVLVNQLALHAAELDTMQSLQHQYDALLQMYGEKEEQLQELRLDLQDVKDMYKMQLDEILMLKRQAAEREEL